MFPAAEFDLRKFLLALIFLGMGGLSAELLLIEHTESFTQWIPLGYLGAGLATTLAVALRPARATLKVFRIVMVAFAVAGALGVYYHYAGEGLAGGTGDAGSDDLHQGDSRARPFPRG